MNKIYLLCTALLLITSINSCKTEEDQKTIFCHDGILNGGEEEIDCGAGCGDCPSEGTLSCIVGNTSFVATGSKVFGQVLGPSLRIYGNNGDPLNFMFVTSDLNKAVPITSVSFAYHGEAYTLEPGDSGYATLTAIDTLRKIASGTFWFTAGRVTGPDTTSVREGVFTNVRYNH